MLKCCEHLPLQKGPPASVVQLGKVPRGLRAQSNARTVAARQRGSWGVTAPAPPPGLEVWRGLHQGPGRWLVGEDGSTVAELQTAPGRGHWGCGPTGGACLGGASSTGLSPTLETLFRSSLESRKTFCLNKEDEASQAWKLNIQSKVKSELLPSHPPSTSIEGKAVWDDNRKGTEVAQARRGDVFCRHSNAHLSHWSWDSRTGAFTEAPALRERSSAECRPTKLPTASAKNTPDIIISLTSTT